MQQEDSCERSRDLISRVKDSSFRLTCGHCSRELIGQVEDLIVDAHGLLCLNSTVGEGDESSNNNCTDTAVWFLKEGLWPDWITQQVDESGWTKGRLSCFACKRRVGAFDFVHGGQCGCPEKQLRPPVQLTKAKVDLKRR
ncbi:E3 ubiquitin-protein ligase RNF180-like [Cloeon dipterum]|uniref:E3 ubiquitin-protein ligase RNF180-like n=1 Tax=Cloeon dipterum TaxID=197152 RepID=UPI00321F7857